MSDLSQGHYRQVQSVPFDYRAMVHDHKWLGSVACARRLSRWLTKLEYPFVGRIHDHRYLFSRAASGREDFSAGLIDGKARVGKAQTPFLERLENPDCRAIPSKLIDGHHQLRHWIVEVEDDFGAQDLRNQRTEHEDIGHVMNMDKVISALQRATGEN